MTQGACRDDEPQEAIQRSGSARDPPPNPKGFSSEEKIRIVFDGLRGEQLDEFAECTAPEGAE
jgi:hypothetical protein